MSISPFFPPRSAGAPIAANDLQDRDLRAALARLMAGLGLAADGGGVAILVADLRAQMILSVTRLDNAAPAEPEPAAGEDDLDGIWVPGRNGQVRVALSEIDWIEAARDYVLLHTAKRQHIHRITMNALERVLNPHRMLRVHRSAFVNPDRVKAVHRAGKGLSALVLGDGVAVPVGPSYVAAVQARLSLPPRGAALIAA